MVDFIVFYYVLINKVDHIVIDRAARNMVAAVVTFEHHK